MSFENGYEANSYIKKCIERYNGDSLIFYKALQIVTTFTQQTPWPHNYEKLNNISATVLGNSMESIIRFTGQYLYVLNAHNTSMRQIEWPDDLPNNFKEDLVAFFYAVEPIIEQAKYGRTNPLRFYGVARSQTPSSETKILKFMRMDNASLEIEMSKNDIKSLIRTLEIMISDSCELKDGSD